jgi:hypothetical protein
MAQGVGPEFKLQYYRKKEGRTEERKEGRKKRKRKKGHYRKYTNTWRPKKKYTFE